VPVIVEVNRPAPGKARAPPEEIAQEALKVMVTLKVVVALPAWALNEAVASTAAIPMACKMFLAFIGFFLEIG
jgi:hypothetical protein